MVQLMKIMLMKLLLVVLERARALERGNVSTDQYKKLHVNLALRELMMQLVTGSMKIVMVLLMKTTKNQPQLVVLVNVIELEN